MLKIRKSKTEHLSPQSNDIKGAEKETNNNRLCGPAGGAPPE